MSITKFNILCFYKVKSVRLLFLQNDFTRLYNQVINEKLDHKKKITSAFLVNEKIISLFYKQMTNTLNIGLNCVNFPYIVYSAVYLWKYKQNKINYFTGLFEEREGDWQTYKQNRGKISPVLICKVAPYYYSVSFYWATIIINIILLKYGAMCFSAHTNVSGVATILLKRADKLDHTLSVPVFCYQRSLHCL